MTWASLAPGVAADSGRLDAVVVAIVKEGRSSLANWAVAALPRLPEEFEIRKRLGGYRRQRFRRDCGRRWD